MTKKEISKSEEMMREAKALRQAENLVKNCKLEINTSGNFHYVELTVPKHKEAHGTIQEKKISVANFWRWI